MAVSRFGEAADAFVEEPFFLSEETGFSGTCGERRPRADLERAPGCSALAMVCQIGNEDEEAALMSDPHSPFAITKQRECYVAASLGPQRVTERATTRQ